MTSPGGVEVGRVSIRVVPDTSKFLADAKKKLKEIAKSLRVEVAVILDPEGIKAELDKIKAEAAKSSAKIDVEADGDGAVRETRRIKQIIQKLVGSIKLIVGVNLPASIARIKAELKVIQNSVEGYRIKIPVEFVGLSKWLGILGLVSGALLTIPHLVGAIGGAVNVVGGLLALLPALAGAAAVGIAALVVGMEGFGAALSASGDAAKFEEALKKLTPSAQEAARALAEFREPLSEIRKSVQESLFQGMAGPLRDLKKLLPPIKQGLTDAAAGIRDMAKAWIEMATSQRSINDTGTIMANIKKLFEQMRPAAANFGQALRDIAVVGSAFLPALGKAVSDVTSKFAAWASEARETGRLEQIIQNSIDKVKQLGRIVADLVVGFQNIFKSMSGGREFLDIIEKVSQGFREWSQAEDTQATLKRLANVMRTVAEAAKELFGEAFEAAGKILKELEPFLLAFARGLATVVGGAIRAVTPLLQSFARWLSENRAVMVPLLITLAALVTSFKLLVTVGNGVLALKKSFDVLKSASTIVGEVATAVGGATKRMIVSLGQAVASAWAATGRFVAAWAHIAAEATKQAATTARVWIASAVKSAAFTARYYAIMAATAVRNFVKMAVAASVNAGKILVAWTVGLVRMVAVTISQMAIAVAVWVANWIRMASVALAQAARMALAWIIAMGPIAWIIAAIIALVALIIIYWDEIVAATKAAWDAVWKFVSDVVTWIWEKIQAVGQFIRDIWDACWKAVSDVITVVADWIRDRIEFIKNVISGIGDIVDKVINFFKSIGDGIRDKWNAAIDFIKSIPGKIMDALGNLGNLLLDAGKKIIQGFLNGLKAAWNAVVDFVKGIGSWIADHKGPLTYDARLLIPHGKAIMEGLSNGLSSGFTRVQTQVSGMGEQLAKAVNASAIGTALATSIEASIPTALSSVDKLMDITNSAATAQWKAEITAEDVKPISEQVLEALASGLTIELDGKNVTKSVNKNNILNRRR
jgi:phage-related protein